jgi:two-component system, NtrC family, sensor histidine kinase HydH
MKNSNIVRLSLLVAFIVGISLLHYLTPLHLPMLHDIFQRLYYIPIILAAFWFGFRGGLISALAVSVLYAPHVLFQWGGHLTMDLEKYLEILLYNVVGGITGFLSRKEQARTMQLQETALGLEKSYNKLQSQADLIIEIEEQLRRAERLSALGEFSAALAHEVRNPLGSIRGVAEILMDDYRPGDSKYEFCEILVKESERLNRVVEDYLRLARPLPVETRSCDIASELHTIVVLLTADAKRRGIRMELAAERLPPVKGDPEKLRQAFLNIILNGLQATPEGGWVTITADHTETAGQETASVVINFKDSGPGIEPDKLDRVFEPFFTTKDGGTGLGLAVTRKIIEGHGGRISIINTPGSGATFRVILPAIPEEQC